MWTEDKVPECKYEGHPRGYDLRRYMQPSEISDSHVVWACMLCSDIYKVPVVQVMVLPKGKEKARYIARARMRESENALRRGRVVVRE